MTEQELDFVRKNFVDVCCPALQRPQAVWLWNDARKKRIEKAVKKYGLPTVQKVFKKTAESEFLTGKNSRGWKANLDWICKPENFLKILEGNYDSKKPEAASTSFDLADAVRKATLHGGV